MALMLMSGLLTGCLGNDKDVFASSQYYTCIYDKEDGTLIEKLPPGGGKVKVEDDAQVWRVPTSQRFWNIDPDDAVRDPGAPKFVTGLDSNYKDVQMVVHAKFFINQTRACDFVDRHGKRNVSADNYGTDDTESTTKMGFNVRGDADQPWFRFLNENLSAAMQSQGKPLLPRYDWRYYEFEYPTNANLDGVVVCDANKECPPKPTALDTLEPEYGELVSKELNKQIGKDFFCGPGYDPEKPDVCPPVQVEILRINLADRGPVEQFQKVIDLKDQADSDRRLATLTRDATDAAVEAQRAQLDQDRAIQEVIDSFGGVDPGVAEAERDAALERAKAAGAAAVAEENAKAAAAEKMAPCTIVGAKGDECARILAALNGNYPQGNGTSVQVNPGN